MRQLMPTPRRPAVTCYPDGRIEIAARIARLLDLHPGDVVTFLEDSREYYIAVAQRAAERDTSSFALRVTPAKQGFHTFRCYCRSVTDQLRSLSRSSGPLPYSFPAGRVRQHPVYGTIITIITSLNTRNP